MNLTRVECKLILIQEPVITKLSMNLTRVECKLANVICKRFSCFTMNLTRVECKLKITEGITEDDTP